ncbi:3-hexulose-6-phosphate synthase [Bifidobacterium lemurum]|uniref:3-hexulose-6-phosphate synthase n=1 Tax=Bifidobacterium lemurum TaxID=1603886 RepID=A0A261FSK4_9BIFI|nr:orotidine 5'-phosphate decarboxylase / HUMPS family protein [Bifidobacterium lemurum]OZG62180.1 3-hexulose-6-phosphate synthase [Bifidobacterium lemurum]QOL33556.1 orotidine 5'-phosphate decarboxylase [Bifidobacterium lemurum]
MKLQVAIDRVDMERARELVERIAGEADIIEIGTSLTKEFGVRALEPLTRKATLLGDIKTCDEGKYEFDLGFACGFKYLTVMGSSSMGTLEACAASAAEHDGVMMVDLLECDEARIEKIAVFPDAVYCLHTSVDSGATKDPVAQVRAFKRRFPQIARIAIAGGIKQNQLSALAAEGLDIVIMGSAITKADDIQAACRACKEEMQ